MAENTKRGRVVSGQIPRDDGYKAPFLVFPLVDTVFDKKISELVKELIFSAMDEIERPTMLELADYFQIKQSRLRNVLTLIGAYDEFKERKVAKIAVYKHRRKLDQKADVKTSVARKRGRK